MTPLGVSDHWICLPRRSQAFLSGLQGEIQRSRSSFPETKKERADFWGPRSRKGLREVGWGLGNGRRKQTDRQSISWGMRCAVWLGHDSESIKLNLATPHPSLSVSEHLFQGVTAGALPTRFLSASPSPNVSTKKTRSLRFCSPVSLWTC